MSREPETTNDAGAALWANVHPILRDELRERIKAMLEREARDRAYADLARAIIEAHRNPR